MRTVFFYSFELRDICGHWIKVSRFSIETESADARKSRLVNYWPGQKNASIWISVCNAVSSGCVSSQAIIAVNCWCVRCGLAGERDLTGCMDSMMIRSMVFFKLKILEKGLNGRTFEVWKGELKLCSSCNVLFLENGIIE